MQIECISLPIEWKMMIPDCGGCLAPLIISPTSPTIGAFSVANSDFALDIASTYIFVCASV